MKIKLYTFETCPYCLKAKKMLNEINMVFEEVVITREELSKLAEETGQRTVPQVFINDKLIGGCDDLEELIKNNGLASE